MHGSHIRGLNKLVVDEWRRMEGIGVVEKMAQIRNPIKKWNKEVFDFINQKISILESEVAIAEEKLHNAVSNEVVLARLNTLRGQLNLWYSRKESYWTQMSRDDLVKDVDRNTKYFQPVASIKKRKKLMVEIQKGRKMLRDPRSIKGEVRR